MRCHFWPFDPKLRRDGFLIWRKDAKQSKGRKEVFSGSFSVFASLGFFCAETIDRRLRRGGDQTTGSLRLAFGISITRKRKSCSQHGERFIGRNAWTLKACFNICLELRVSSATIAKQSDRRNDEFIAGSVCPASNSWTMKVSRWSGNEIGMSFSLETNAVTHPCQKTSNAATAGRRIL